MPVDKSKKTKKIQEIIDKFESQCRMRTIERIYELEDVYVVETSTQMAIKNFEPYYVIKKESFNIKHHSLKSKEKLPKLKNMIYESKEVVEREARSREYNDAFCDEIMKLIEEEENSGR